MILPDLQREATGAPDQALQVEAASECPHSGRVVLMSSPSRTLPAAPLGSAKCPAPSVRMNAASPNRPSISEIEPWRRPADPLRGAGIGTRLCWEVRIGRHVLPGCGGSETRGPTRSVALQETVGLASANNRDAAAVPGRGVRSFGTVEKATDIGEARRPRKRSSVLSPLAGKPGTVPHAVALPRGRVVGSQAIRVRCCADRSGRPGMAVRRSCTSVRRRGSTRTPIHPDMVFLQQPRQRR